MKLHTNKMIALLLSGLLLLPLSTVFAGIPEPDNLVYGTVSLSGQAITAADTNVMIEVALDGNVIDDYTMGDDPAALDNYVLAVPMDSTGARTTNYTRPGDVVTIRYRAGSLVGVAATVVLGERGVTHKIDLQLEGDADGDGILDGTDPDDDNDGIPDVNDAFPLDPNESVDTDGDGIGNNADPDDDNDGYTDAKETAAGTNPLDSESHPQEPPEFPWEIFMPAIFHGGNAQPPVP